MSLLRCLLASDAYRARAVALLPGGSDVFHTNGLHVLDGAHAHRSPAFARGNVMVSMRHLDAIYVVDLDRELAIWGLSGTFRAQHDPQLLDNGNILLFDNLGRPGASSVLEIDPLRRVPIWAYAGSADAPFYSETCGTAQRLPNGNTLITETDAGRSFETTAEREIVWEFHSPFRAGAADEYIATLFDVVRLPAEFPLDWVGR